MAGVSPYAAAQTDNPVYVDDSPQAWELFRQAQDQTRHNGGEAVRLYQELLDEFPLKLIPATDAAGAADHFKAVRRRVLEALANDAPLLERYRTMQKQASEQLLGDSQARSDSGEVRDPIASLEQLALTRSLTEAGLEALLRLSQRDFEAGRFRRALAYLDEARAHPDFAGRRAAHALFMFGMASHHVQDAESTQKALAELALLGAEAEPLRKRLAAIVLVPAPAAALPVSTLDVGPVSDLHDVVAEAIWSAPLEDSLLRRRMELTSEDQPLTVSPAAAEFNRRAEIERSADTITIVPTVAGEMVFTNEGHTIRAVNRLSGRTLWTYANANRLSFTERDVQGSLDLNVIAIDGRDLVTLTGHAQVNGRSESGRVLCLDASSGELRWSKNLASPPLMEASANEQLFPHGAPIIADGMVFVAARRVSMQSMTSAYVVALSLADGRVQWVRYITSSGGLRALRPFDTLINHRGALYINTAVGAAARLDPTTGEVRWLVRFSAPFNTGLAEQSRRPWEMTGPVATTRGILTIEPSLRRVVLLDAETGATLESREAGSGSEWNAPRYLLADQNRVYSIGTDIRAFELDDLEHAAWRLPGLQKSEIKTSEPAGGRTEASNLRPVTSNLSAFELRGRVQLVDGALIAPCSSGVLVVNSETGEIANNLPLLTAGNPVAVESQLLLAGGDRLDSYMSFNRAQSMLRARIAQTPADPEPALSLLRLGMRVKNLALALEAADLATKAIGRLPESETAAGERRGELVSLLLELADARIQTSVNEGEALFAALSAAAIDHQHRVSYLLAYGDWLATISGAAGLDRAVEAYQAILSEPALAESWRSDDAVLRPSASFAARRLSELMSHPGSAVYAAQSDFAAVRLKHITSAGAPDVKELQALADEFPFSDAALEASLLAAQSQSQRGDHRAALATLLRLHRAAPRDANNPRLLGRLVSIASQAGWSAQLQAIMRQTLAAHGDLPLITDTGSVKPSEWLLGAAKSLRPRWPTIADPSAERPLESISITGQVVPLHPSTYSALMASGQSQLALPADRALIRAGNALQLIRFSPPAGAPGHQDPPAITKPQVMWTFTLPGEASAAAFILGFSDQDILLWTGSEPRQMKVVMLNAADGALLWTSAGAAELFEDIAGRSQTGFGGGRGGRDPMPDGESFEPEQIIPLVHGRTLVLVQRTGAALALDLANGRTVRWKKNLSAGADRSGALEQIHFAALHESVMVLAGVGKLGTGGTAESSVPRFVALDLESGAPLFDDLPRQWVLTPSQHDARKKVSDSPFAGSSVKWMRVTPLGLLTFGTAQGLHAVDLHSGRRLWSSTSPDVIDSTRAWVAATTGFDGRLVLEDQRGRLRSIGLNDGATTDPFELPWRGEGGGGSGGTRGWEGLELRNLLIVPGLSNEPAAPRGARAIAHYSQRVAMYDAATGAILGADVVSDDRDYRFLLAAQVESGENRLLAISGRSVQAPIADQLPGAVGGRRTQWSYRIYCLSENGKVLCDPFELPPLSERVQHAAVIDGCLLLSTQSEIVAIPMMD